MLIIWVFNNKTDNKEKEIGEGMKKQTKAKKNLMKHLEIQVFRRLNWDI